MFIECITVAIFFIILCDIFISFFHTDEFIKLST